VDSLSLLKAMALWTVVDEDLLRPFVVVNHQSVLAVMGLWVAVASGYVTLVWLLKPKIY